MPEFNLAFFTAVFFLGLLNWIVVLLGTKLGSIEVVLGLIILLEVMSYATYFGGKATGVF